MYDLYNDDLLRNPRAVETSATVLAAWTREEDAYDSIFPPRNAPPESMRQFANITAERVFFRRKILGFYDAEADFIGTRIVRNARPFGAEGPTLAELLATGVTAVMTYVPLASMQGNGESVLARLYCVDGLRRRYPLPFYCPDDANRREYNLFLPGMDYGNRPCGTSWQLAAAVLEFAIRERHATVNIRKKLAGEYVFTGAVGTDSHVTAVTRVSEKTALGRQMPRRLTWILPKVNRPEAGDVKSKGVATLDDAYEHVLGLGPETETLLELVRGGTNVESLRAIRIHLRNDADANAVPSDGRNVRQTIMANIQRKIVGLIRTDGLKNRPVIEIQNEIRKSLAPEWDAEKASSYYGNDPLLFFLAAKSGDDALIRSLRAKMDIDAVDRDGETALDFAIEAGDREVERRLRLAGARRRGIYALNSKRVRAFLRDPETEFAVDNGRFIMEALDFGLDPLAETDFGTDENGKSVERERKMWDNIKAAADPWEGSPMSDYSYSKTSVLKEAILMKKRVLVEKCLELLKRTPHAVPEEYIKLAKQYSSPLVIKALRR